MSPVPFEAHAARLDDGVQVVSVRGELDLSNAAALEPALESAIASGDGAVLVDLGECEFIDSTGIALLVRAWQRFDAAASGEGSGRLVICSDNAQVRRVLEITGLKHSMAIHESREQALAALRD